MLLGRVLGTLGPSRLVPAAEGATRNSVVRESWLWVEEGREVGSWRELLREVWKLGSSDFFMCLNWLVRELMHQSL